MMVGLIDNRLDDKTLANHLSHLLARAREAYIHVAYLRVSGLALLQDAIIAFITRGGRLRILAGGDFAQTEPDGLQSFQALGGDSEVKLVSSSGLDGFHPKCYLFYTTHQATLIVGSSNFTAGGLVQNIELNVRLDLAADHPVMVNARMIFDHLWNATPPLTDERLADYRRYWEACQRQASAFLYRLPLEEGKPAMPEATEPAWEVQVGDTVSVNGQIGQVVSMAHLGTRLSVGVAIEGVGLRTILSPPTVLTVVDTPLSRMKKLAFDPPALFDLLTEATWLSLAFEHDRLVSLSNSRAKLEPYQVGRCA
jgi:HKD family nuclease